MTREWVRSKPASRSVPKLAPKLAWRDMHWQRQHRVDLLATSRHGKRHKLNDENRSRSGIRSSRIALPISSKHEKKHNLGPVVSLVRSRLLICMSSKWRRSMLASDSVQKVAAQIMQWQRQHRVGLLATSRHEKRHRKNAARRGKCGLKRQRMDLPSSSKIEKKRSCGHVIS